MNYKIVSYILGTALKLEAIALLIPTIIAACYGEDSWWALLITAGIAAVLGFVLGNKKFKEGRYYAREGYAATALAWIILPTVGCIPFILSGTIPNFVDALFETASGFTTTGSSVLTEIEHLGKGLIFWRSFIHWLGGMGILVFILAILPLSGGFHMHLMKAESPGPNVSKLVPKVKETAKVLYLIYAAMTVLCILTLLISGMDLFDAVCIGVGTAGTGGFSIRNSGMADYSVVSQACITVWMILFGVNFNVYYFIIRKRFKEAVCCEEARFYLIAIVLMTAAITLNVYFNNYREEGLFTAFHNSFFMVGSLITSTGFGTVDTNTWPLFSKVLMILCMTMGACAGSTGGGFKVSRIMLLLKEAKKEFLLLTHPNAVKTVKFEGKAIEHGTMRSLTNYLIIYILIFIVSIVVLSFDKINFLEAFSATLATINNIGPGFGIVGTFGNYSSLSVVSKIMLTFNMIAGRLELLPILMLFYPKTWAKHY